jgi:hypothetical protein
LRLRLTLLTAHIRRLTQHIGKKKIGKLVSPKAEEVLGSRGVKLNKRVDGEYDER